MLTLIDLLVEQVRVRPDAAAFRSKRQGRWQSTSWRVFHDAARAFAAALVARGVPPGARVGVLTGTREEAVIADWGALMAGAVAVPIYPTLTPDQVVFVLRDCDARVLVVDDDAKLQRIEADPGYRPLDLVVSLRSGWDALLAEGRALLADGADGGDLVTACSAAVGAEDVAAIFYTSGTTGEPKGAVLTHDAFLFEVSALFELLGVSAEDEQLLFLPLAHIFGKLLVVAAMRVGAVTAFAQSMLTVLDDAEEVRPTFLGSVPRLFEKVHEVALVKAKEAGAVQEKIFHWAIGVGDQVARMRRRGEPIPLSLELQRRYADKLVLAKVRGRFGGRLRFAVSGAAPLDRPLFEWFHAIGILVLEGYGLTETCGALTLNRPQAFRSGTVGRALPGVELRVADDGEILARGANLSRGYFRNDGPPDPRGVIDAEGFLHTGDVGDLDGDGFLRITDRKKDLLITAGGKNVAPQRVEGRVLRSPWVARAVVVGDRRPFLVALLVLDDEAIRRAGVAPEAAARAAIDDANADLAPFETIKRWAILDRDLSTEEGELTPTLKVRRRAVEERFAGLIDGLYR
ncbi:MAG: long-chain fatty acid--CoA ligase [Deltaproteobacteria bacterium]|nr:long-chain fatty acid--CoA ligase [Deltaproteobacteria bacterium]